MSALEPTREQLRALNLALTERLYGWRWCQWTPAAQEAYENDDNRRGDAPGLGKRFLTPPDNAAQQIGAGMFLPAPPDVPIARHAADAVMPIADNTLVAVRALLALGADDWKVEYHRPEYVVTVERALQVCQARGAELAPTIAVALGRTFGL